MLNPTCLTSMMTVPLTSEDRNNFTVAELHLMKLHKTNWENWL